jgi:predicted dehydrogenase
MYLVAAEITNTTKCIVNSLMNVDTPISFCHSSQPKEQAQSSRFNPNRRYQRFIMTITRIGVVGIGHQGKRHLQKYQQIEDCVIVGISDSDENCIDDAGECFGCRAYTDHRDLIGKVDAVSITVPTDAHYATAKDFLANGIHILLEKPMAKSLDEADELIELSKEHKAILQIGFIERFNPAITALTNYLERPLFIEAHRLHPFFIRGTEVDVILDLMIHDLDIILHFVHSPVKQVDATGISVLSDQVDIANARIKFENGCVANITASRVTNKVMQKIRFFGKQGYNSIDYAKREIISLYRLFDDEGKPIIGENPVSIESCDPLETEIRAFVHSVRNGQRPAVTGEEARASLELGLQIIGQIDENLEQLQL